MTPTQEIRRILVLRARSRIGHSIYHRYARLEDAPAVFNCYRFTQWVWCGAGVLLPDHQLTCPAADDVEIGMLSAADLVFVPRMNRALDTDDFGHVGLASGVGTVIHATKWRNGVVEDPLEEFISRGCLGVRRVRI